LVSKALALECDPEQILARDRSVSELYGQVALAYSKQVIESKATSDAQSIEGQAVIFGIPLKVSYQTASALATLIEQTLHVSYSKEEYRYFLREYLSDNAVQAYKDCLNQDGVHLSIAKDAYKSSSTMVIVHWIGGPFAPSSAKVRVSIDNGVIGEQ